MERPKSFRRVLMTGGSLLASFLFWRRFRRRESSSAGPEQHRPPFFPPAKRAHVIPGSLCLFVTHTADVAREDISHILNDNDLVRDALRNATVDPQRVFSFILDGRAFSLVFIDVPDARQEDQLLQLVNNLNRRLKYNPPFKNQRYDSPEQRRAAWQSTRSRLLESPTDDVALMCAAPNWLIGSAPFTNGTGSPGAKPVPTSDGSDLDQFLQRDQLHLTRPRETQGEGVEVFILDTAPDEQDIDLAMKRWPGHTLLHNLRNVLTIDYAGGSHLLQSVDMFHPNANYVMSDHGLFVAGIVHAVAPAARLHLIEVLNPYGVGSFESIVRGFQIAAEAARQGRKVLINASLGFEVAPIHPEGFTRAKDDDGFWRRFSPTELASLVAPVALICSIFTTSPQDNSRAATTGMIAAAGNDKKDRAFTPPARFPAAFPNVLGVGAVDRQLAPTTYSNESDDPVTDGKQALGGEANGEVTDASFGIPGVYIGRFPDGLPNTRGWARWAGTSFATPIITGKIAALMSDGETFEQALSKL